MKHILIGLISIVAVGLAAGCGPSHQSAAVASISSSAGGQASPGAYSTSRVAELHTAAQCIRTHGIPSYQDPVLTADGQVFTDSRSILDYESTVGGAGAKGNDNQAIQSIVQACGSLMTAAGLQPTDEPAAPPPLVQAGVKAAQCLRAHGLPNYRDPTSSTPFTPGHGFGISSDEMPNNGANGKLDPTFQSAMAACRTLLDGEITASELTSLAHD